MRVRSCHSWLGLLVCGFIVCVSADVHAQAWLSDRKRTEGSGIRVGDLELHPGLGAEGGYFSNVFNADKNLQDSFALRLSPHLLLSTLGEERLGADNQDGVPVRPGFVAFRGGLSASLLHYFSASKMTVIGTNADFELTLAPKRPVSFVITEGFGRTAQPFTESGLPKGASNIPNYARDQENIGAKFVFMTPGGLLKSSLGYRFGFDFFEGADFKANNNLTHNINLNANWEFLPKTALFYDATYSHQNYTNDGPKFVHTTKVSDNDQISTRLGLNGAITSRISATLAAGYSAGFAHDGNDYEGVNANAEARYVPGTDTETAVGYDRTISTAYQGGHQTRDRVYLRGRWMSGGAFVINGKAGIEFIKFGVDQFQGKRSDQRYFADLSGEYRFVSWLAATGQVGVIDDATNFKFVTMIPASGTTPAMTIVDPAKYVSVEAWLGLRAFY